MNMLLSSLCICAACLMLGAVPQATRGILDLVQRRLPNHVNDFEFQLIANGTGNGTKPVNDDYIVSSTSDGKIRVQGNSLSALSSG
jgi:alpha-N-acetylglucosaminidase